MNRLILAASALTIGLLPGLAGAAVLTTVDATFDPFLQNTDFTITNVSGSAESNLLLTTNLGPTVSVAIPDLAAGQSEQYYFNQVNGGFLVGAGDNDVPDTTTYQLSLTFGGQTLSSNVFSPAANLTGGDVDFLGNSCFGYGTGCPVATDGIVAEVTAVPEPAQWVMMIIGFCAVALRQRRAAVLQA